MCSLCVRSEALSFILHMLLLFRDLLTEFSQIRGKSDTCTLKLDFLCENDVCTGTTADRSHMLLLGRKLVSLRLALRTLILLSCH